MTRKVGEVLKLFALGLAQNQGIPAEMLMVFSHQLLTENLPKLFAKTKKCVVYMKKLCADSLLFTILHGDTICESSSVFSNRSPIEEDDGERENESEAKGAESKWSMRPKSCYLLEKEPGRSGAVPKTSRKSTVHVLIEFALQSFAAALKKSEAAARFRSGEDGQVSQELMQLVRRLDPFVPLLMDCLKSKYDKVGGNG